VILAVVGLAVVIALAVVLLTKGGGSSPPKTVGSTSVTSPSTVTTAGKPHHKKAAKPGVKAAPPAETTVSVLNGTETTGLAHRISSSLQQSGYSQATALTGRPPGANEATVVEYASGHQADAEGVARTLSVSHLQPEEQAVAVLAGSASVVVIVGADKAKA
jgi:LytR cell envelope-related transcriptional attenuator